MKKNRSCVVSGEVAGLAPPRVELSFLHLSCTDQSNVKFIRARTGQGQGQKGYLRRVVALMVTVKAPLFQLSPAHNLQASICKITEKMINTDIY